MKQSKDMSAGIEKLIVKFLSKEANFNELQELELWLSNPKNESLFLAYINTNAYVEKVMGSYDKEKAKENILRRIRQEKKPVPLYKKAWFKYSAAASILILITAGIWFAQTGGDTESIAPTIVNNKIEPGTDKATLTLETGEVVALKKGTTYQTQNATSNGDEIRYHKNTSQELVYNYLTVPRGGQYQMTLSDGTKVWLNSETQLKYPVSFTDGKSRQVELVYGEAYFDVSPSTEHKGSDFKVYHEQQEVKVLGTEFNIKAYTNEANIYTALVEGKVLINTQSGSNALLPGEQSVYNTANNTIKVTSVDIRSEIAWKDGVYIFKNKSLKEIMQTLSRWYDMDVVFENKELENIEFIGSLNKDQKIVDVLNDIKNFGVIKNYSIDHKTITLE
nr:FecR domain-containing protein [uncultured Allomuricauda sp.]